ncbi:MAG: alpha/beta hydrolase [Motiliproteus sp.]
MKVIFFHGKESGPWGSKIRYLAQIAKEHGCRVESDDYAGINNPDDRVAKFLKSYSEDGPVVLVGSSMGGYVATVASAAVKPRGLFLMAPAFYMPGYDVQHIQLPDCPLSIVHGWHDDIVPPENSLRFAEEHNASLHLLDSDHRLNSQLAEIGGLFGLFLKGLTS